MMVRGIILAFLCCISLNYAALGDEARYAVNNIPKELLEDASAVVRIKETELEIVSNDEAVQKVKIAVTIFKKTDEDYGAITLHYDKFREIDELEGTIYNENGEVIRELDDGEIEDICSFSDYTFYQDTRLKKAELYHNRYPYTVEYNIRITYNGYIDFPDWYAQTTMDAVELASYTIVIPADYKLRYWCNQDSVKPEISNKDSKIYYRWKANNLKKLSRDVIGDYVEDVTTIVKAAPSDFEIDGFEGSMLSWNYFGKWYSSLLENRNSIPAEEIKKINEIAMSASDVHEKISKLYKYMQSGTRYVSVQLGIGGWQPFDAKYVYEKGYGDCKALSNYMSAILNAAGINAYSVIINSGKHRYPMITEFPSNQFNHVICCVPLEKDTVWLECTDQYSPPNYLGSFTENRNALLIGKDGGVVVRTPQSCSEDNMQVRYTNLKFKATGEADIISSTLWTGNQQDDVRGLVNIESPDNKQKWVINSMNVSDVNLKSFNFELSNSKPQISLSAKASLLHYASLSGKRFFFQPNILEKGTYIPKDVEKRLSPVIFSFPYKDIDSVVITLPENYSIESLPEKTEIVYSFGHFVNSTTLISDSQILFKRMLEINTYSIPSENYQEYRKFRTDVVKADKAQVVLIKNK